MNQQETCEIETEMSARRKTDNQHIYGPAGKAAEAPVRLED